MIGRVLRLPPVLFLLTVTAAGVLHVRFPLTLGMPSFALGMTAGAIVMIVAVTIASLAFVEMRRHRTTIEPGQRPTSLVVGSVFAYTRNPLYVSLVLVVAALALMIDSWWFVAGAAVLGLVLDRVVVRSEERVLEEVFAGEYLAYKRRVRRWV